MRKHYLSGVAAIALALGATAAGAQNVDQRRNTDQPQPGVQQSQEGPQQGADTDEAHKSGLIALDQGEQTRIGDFIRRARIQPVTRLNFPLSVGETVPSSVRLSPISGELADIFPNFRDFNFFVARQELVVVDPQSHAMVAFAPISAGSAVATTPPRANAGTVATGEPPGPATKAAEPPPPAKKKAARTDNQRVTVTDDRTLRRRPAQTETDVTVGRGPAQTETDVTVRPGPAQTETDVTVGRPPVPAERDVTVGASPSERDVPYALPPRDRRTEPPPRERFGRDQGLPFPFSLLFGRWN
jgi:hypothetical protein